MVVALFLVDLRYKSMREKRGWGWGWGGGVEKGVKHHWLKAQR